MGLLPSLRSLVSSSGKAPARTSLLPLTRMVMVLFPLMNGWGLLTVTIRNNLSPQHLTSLTKKHLSKTVKMLVTQTLNLTRRSTGSPGNVSRPLMLTEMARSPLRRLGLPAPYQTAEEQAGLFKKMDENGDGSISYDEWLSCFIQEIIGPVAA